MGWVFNNILNQRQTPAIFADVFANRPAAGFIGRVFISTDTFLMYRDNGTSWNLIGGSAPGTYVPYTGATTSVNLGVNTISAFNFISTDDSSGNGTNYKVGNDTYLGDKNTANTLYITGIQTPTVGYVKFGADTGQFGYNGTNLLYSGVFEESLSQNSSLNLKVTNTNNGINGKAAFQATSDISVFDISSNSSTRTATRYGVSLASICEIRAITSNGLMIGTGTDAKPIIFGSNNLEAFRVADTTNNILIGTATDNGSKLQVVGVSYLSSRLNVNGAADNSTYALNVTGNENLTGNLNVNTISVYSGNASTSKTTGAITVVGGLGITGTYYGSSANLDTGLVVNNPTANALLSIANGGASANYMRASTNYFQDYTGTNQLTLSTVHSELGGRLNISGATDNSTYTLNNNGNFFSYNIGWAMSFLSGTQTVNGTGTYIYNGTGIATWTLDNPSANNKVYYIKNVGTGVLTVSAYAGTNIVDNTGASVASITVAIGATVILQHDGNVKTYQLK